MSMLVKKPVIVIDGRAIRYPDDGISRNSRKLIEKMVQQNPNGYHWIVLKTGYYFDKRIFPNTTIKELPIPYFYLRLKTVFCLWRIVNRLKPSLFHALFPVLSLFLKTKKVITVNDLIWVVTPELQIYGKPIYKLLGHLFHKLVFTAAMRSADKIISISKTTAEEIRKININFFNKTTVVYCGNKEIQKYDLSDVKLDTLNVNRNYFIFIGNTKPYKNIDGVLKSFEKLISQARYKDVFLYIAGRKDVLNKTISEYVSNSEQLKTNVVFLGNVPDNELYCYLTHAVSLVFPSRQEGFGLPVVEAFSLKVPVITSDIPIFREITQGEAILVDPYNLDSICDGMKTALEDKEVLKQNVEKAYKVAQKYNWDDAAKQVLNVYKELLEKNQ